MFGASLLEIFANILIIDDRVSGIRILYGTGIVQHQHRMVEGIVFFRNLVKTHRAAQGNSLFFQHFPCLFAQKEIAAAGGRGPIAVELNHLDRPELVEGHHCEYTLNYLMCKFFLIPVGVSEGFQSYVHRRNHADAFGYG